MVGPLAFIEGTGKAGGILVYQREPRSRSKSCIFKADAFAGWFKLYDMVDMIWSWMISGDTAQLICNHKECVERAMLYSLETRGRLLTMKMCHTFAIHLPYPRR